MIHPAFVLSCGDLVYGNEESLAMYRKELDEMQPLLKSLNVPFYNAPGNHEINNRVDFEKEYVSRFGPLDGMFDFGGWRFLGVATDPAGHTAAFGDDQVKELQNMLSSPKPKFVYMHRPVFVREGNDEQ